MAEFADIRTVNCPYCGNSKVVKNGRRDGYQRYRCKPCGKQFKHTGELHGRHAPSGRIGAAIRMFYSGMSYKQIAENLAERDDIPEPSKQTLYAWVKHYTDAAVEEMQSRPAQTGPEWVADEMQVRVGGENLWHWNVMDAKTRYVLATHLSPNRDTRATVAVMRKAAQAATAPPARIKTDRLGSYPPAIKAVFPETKHVPTDGIRALINNNLSERLQGTYRQRDKTLRGLDNIESGQRYLDGWTLTYNLFREDEGIDYQTPAEMAHVNAPFGEWEDVVKMTPTSERTRTRARDAAAQLSDAPLQDERTARGNVILVPDPTARCRPKGESDSDDPELPSQWPRQDSDGGKPAMLALDNKATLTNKRVARLPELDRATGKGASVKVAAMRPKLATQKRMTLLRPDEQKPDTGKAVKTRRGKRQRRYAKARKAHQQQSRR